MGVWLTNRDTMFTRDEYQQLLYSCLLPESNTLFKGRSSRIITLPPSIMKPKPLWIGKQVITTILENIKPKYFHGLTLYSKSRTSGDSWYPGCEEGRVVFHDGYFVSGVLDKNQLGPSEFGLIHSRGCRRCVGCCEEVIDQILPHEGAYMRNGRSFAHFRRRC